MRICVVNLARIADEHVAFMERIVQAICRRVLEADTEVAFRAPQIGPLTPFERMADYRNSYFSHLIAGQVIETIIAADREGFDAIVVNCFDDPGVRESRSMVRAQVFGLCDPTLAYAAVLGDRLGALVPNLPGQVNFVENQIRAFGLSGRFVANGVRADTGRTAEDFAAAMQQPSLLTGRLRQQARELVEAGAEVIVMACGGLGLVCELDRCYQLEHAGMRVPLVSPLSVAVKTAEMTVRLQRALGMPGTSQAHALRALASADRERFRRDFGLPD